MTVYNFGSNFANPNQSVTPPEGLREIPSIRQTSHAEGGRKNFTGDNLQTYPSHNEEYVMQAFKSLDEGIKLYFSSIRVPTKDSYRLMRTKIAGGDKSLLVWTDEINEGKAILPVASISRDSESFDANRFSPPYAPMNKRFLSSRGDMVALIYRPIPYTVDYSMSVWAERKRDIGYIQYQIMTRFNPCAQFRISDGKMAGNVLLKELTSTDVSEKEVGYNQYASVRYDFTFKAEAWLPIPEKIVKTVLGQLSTIKEQVSDVFYDFLG